MIHIVTAENYEDYASQMYAFFKLRHRMYAEQLGWSAIQSPLSLDVDEYDTDDCVYLLALDDTDELLGGIRLTPVTKRTLLNDHYANRLNEPLRPDPSVYEITRFTLKGFKATMPNGMRVSSALNLSAIDYGLENGISAFVALMDLRIAEMLLRNPIEIQQLGDTFAYDEGSCLPIKWACSRTNRDALARSYGFNDYMLTNQLPDRVASFLPKPYQIRSVADAYKHEKPMMAQWPKRLIEEMILLGDEDLIKGWEDLYQMADARQLNKSLEKLGLSPQPLPAGARESR